MLNGREQKKGGFRAFVERENERGQAAAEDARLRAAKPAATPASPILDRPVLVTEDAPRTEPTAHSPRADKTTNRPVTLPWASRR